jgi:thioredoxin-dependent peroxiredoxin
MERMSEHAVHEGEQAPEITLNDDKAQPFQLSALKGKSVVLYFYPRADTPGCTKEACEFRDAREKFQADNAVIVGVSPDASGLQSDFKNKFDLPFTLLADIEHKTAEDYGVWEPMTWQGNTFMAAARTTFLIDKNGTIRKIFRKVKPEGHAAEVYQALKELA